MQTVCAPRPNPGTLQTVCAPYSYTPDLFDPAGLLTCVTGLAGGAGLATGCFAAASVPNPNPDASLTGSATVVTGLGLGLAVGVALASGTRAGCAVG